MPTQKHMVFFYQHKFVVEAGLETVQKDAIRAANRSSRQLTRSPIVPRVVGAETQQVVSSALVASRIGTPIKLTLDDSKTKNMDIVWIDRVVSGPGLPL